MQGGVNWGALLERSEAPAAAYSNTFLGKAGGPAGISFVMSRPSHALFPLNEFRSSCETVLVRHDLADILQLGSPSGYEPLRRYLMEEAHAQGTAGPGDDLLITNGCQQGLDLLGRVLLRVMKRPDMLAQVCLAGDIRALRTGGIRLAAARPGR